MKTEKEQEGELEKTLKYLSRRPHETPELYRNRVINALLTEANMTYGLERSALIKVHRDNGDSWLEAFQGAGPLTEKEHKERALPSIAGKGFADILKSYDPENPPDKAWNDFLRENKRIPCEQGSIFDKVVREKLSHEGGELDRTSLTDSDNWLLDTFRVDQFIALTVKGQGEKGNGESEKVDWILYGDRKFTGGDLRVDKREINLFRYLTATELQSIENEISLIRMEKELARRKELEALGLGVAVVVHEIQTPLVAIGGYARQLFNIASEESLLFAAIIEKQTRRLEIILNSYLDFASPNLKANKKKTDLYDVVEEGIKIVDNYEVTYEIKSGGESIDAYVDPDHLIGSVANLAKNAFKAIAYDKDRRGNLTVTFETDGDYVNVKFHNPQYIPPTILNKIMDVFFTTREGVEGYGLGMTIVNKYMDANGGFLIPHSREEEGTTFTMRLPLYKGQAGSTSE